MREIFIERRDKLLRIAVKDNKKLTECFMEEENDEAYPGQIYKGIVKNIVPAIKCAFIDIGLGKNAFLYMDSKHGNMNIKKGDELVVEVIKEEVGTKGAKVTNNFSIAGRYAVLVTTDRNLSFSSKLKDENIKKILGENIIKPEEIGVMIRTNAVGVECSIINNEIQRLFETYKRIVTEANYSIKPGLLFSDEGVLDRVLRDCIDKNTERIVMDNENDYNHVLNVSHNISDVKINPELYCGRRTLFDYYDIETEILKLRENKVHLSCGGYIIIDKTEAMYVIDVNSGKNVSSEGMRKTAITTNIQAAQEIAEQIRLRNLSGIIVIDFIDVEEDSVKEKIIQVLQKGFENDKNKTIIFPFTELNLVQIARRRRGKSINEYMEEECGECRGKGKSLKLSYISLLVRNEILRNDIDEKIKDFYIEMNDLYKTSIESDINAFIEEIGALGKRIYLKFSKEREYFKLQPLLFASQIEGVYKFKIYG